MGPREISRQNLARQRLDAAIRNFGLNATEAIEDLATLVENMHRPSSMDAATRHLILEWLGAQDGVVDSSGRLTHRDLMRVMVRSTAIDALNALPVERAARALRVPASVCQQMIDSGHLWSYNFGTGPRVPTWQLTRRSPGASAIPISEALPIVVAAIPTGESPAFLRHLMNVEHGALLDGDNQAVTPRRWLLAGLPPWPVVSILVSATGGDVEAAAASFVKE